MTSGTQGGGDGEERWMRANLALACFALDPYALGGIWLRARVGPVRDRFMAGLTLGLRRYRTARLHPGIGDDALFGGVDLAGTLESGTLTRTKGLLQEAGVFVLPMAERTAPGLGARLSAAMDGAVPTALVALDEGVEADERPPNALIDRMAIHIDLTDQALGDAPELSVDTDALVVARRLLPQVTVPDGAIAELCTVAAALGVTSLRAPLQALAAARAAAALSGETEVESADLITAVELVLAPRATRLPEETQDPPPEETPPEPEPEDDSAEEPQDPPDAEEDDDLPPPPVEMLLEAAKAMLPPDVLTRMKAGQAARNAQAASGTGDAKKGNRRGRPMPSRAGRLGGEARVDMVATLRAAAPWQPLRRKTTGKDDRIHIRMSDIRVRQFEEKSDRAIIFVVDASGSSAMTRLAEAKGAIELMLGEAYSRRDHVALVAFRGDGAEVLLPPTRSLVQTKRRLAQLPGGGGTPLAAGLRAAMDLTQFARGKGMTPCIAVLTDGRANVDLAGIANRAQAAEDARQMALALRSMGTPGIIIDTGLRPTRALSTLADDMAVAYLPLPRADARAVSTAVGTVLDG